MLNISTRSIDRYIKAGKVRAKKEWKIVYVHQWDVDSILLWWNMRQEIIMDDDMIEKNNISHYESKIDLSALERIYDDLRSEIQKKDHIIQTLSMRVGQSEEVAKNSVSLLDYKKSQFLLEESKSHLSKELDVIIEEKSKLQAELKYEKKSNTILIVFVVLLLVLAGFVWFLKI